MYTNDNYMTSYKAGHRILPTAAFESNVCAIKFSLLRYFLSKKTYCTKKVF